LCLIPSLKKNKKVKVTSLKRKRPIGLGLPPSPVVKATVLTPWAELLTTRGGVFGEKQTLFRSL
jgi:hypothetical protein